MGRLLVFWLMVLAVLAQFIVIERVLSENVHLNVGQHFEQTERAQQTCKGVAMWVTPGVRVDDSATC